MLLNPICGMLATQTGDPAARIMFINGCALRT